MSAFARPRIEARPRMEDIPPLREVLNAATLRENANLTAMYTEIINMYMRATNNIGGRNHLLPQDTIRIAEILGIMSHIAPENPNYAGDHQHNKPEDEKRLAELANQLGSGREETQVR